MDNSKNILNERSQMHKTTYCIIHLYKLSRKGKSVETRSAVALGWGPTTNGHKGGLWCDGNVLKQDYGNDCTVL